MKKRNCSIHGANTKKLISCAVTAQLICDFVFSKEKRLFLKKRHKPNLLNTKICCSPSTKKTCYSLKNGCKCLWSGACFRLLEPCHKKTSIFAFNYAKTKVQISCAVTAQLISTFVFFVDQLCSNCTADQYLCFCSSDSIQFLFHLNPKFQAYMCTSVTVQADLCLKPQRPVFFCRGSFAQEEGL